MWRTGADEHFNRPQISIYRLGEYPWKRTGSTGCSKKNIQWENSPNETCHICSKAKKETTVHGTRSLEGLQGRECSGLKPVLCAGLWWRQEGGRLQSWVTSCPASLLEPDPSLDQGYAMQKGNKAEYWILSAIKTSLGSSWREMDRLPQSNKPAVMVVDAMAFIQHHRHLGRSTFQELQLKYLKQLLSSMPENCDCIHFVGDQYHPSWKSQRRRTRQNNEDLPQQDEGIQATQNSCNTWMERVCLQSTE